MQRQDRWQSLKSQKGTKFLKWLQMNLLKTLMKSKNANKADVDEAVKNWHETCTY